VYAQRQSINVQRIQTLRGAVAAEEIPDFSGTFHAGLGFCFSGLHDAFVTHVVFGDEM
jgi:hypothetical protein